MSAAYSSAAAMNASASAKKANPANPETLAVTYDADSANTVRIALRIPEDLRCFEGHFQDCSVVPGVVQLHWAIAYGQQHFPEYFVARPNFSRLVNIKFMRVIVPGKKVTLLLRQLSERQELAFEYRIDDNVCSSGQLGFVA